MGFKVYGLGYRVSGLRLRVWGLGFRVKGLGFRVRGSGFRAQCLTIIAEISSEVHCRVCENACHTIELWLAGYSGTSLIRNSEPLGPYSRTMHRALW